MISQEKLKILTLLQKLPKNWFGQTYCCCRLWKVSQSSINHPIWSHWLYVHFTMAEALLNGYLARKAIQKWEESLNRGSCDVARPQKKISKRLWGKFNWNRALYFTNNCKCNWRWLCAVYSHTVLVTNTRLEEIAKWKFHWNVHFSNCLPWMFSKVHLIRDTSMD